MDWDFNTPKGTVTITASALKMLEQPDCVDRACTSTPAHVCEKPSHYTILLMHLQTLTISTVVDASGLSIESDIQSLGQMLG